MKSNESTLVVGGLMVAAGLLFLLTNLGVLALLSGLLIAGLFAVGGLALAYLSIQDRDKWWAAIPAFALLGLGASVMVVHVWGWERLGGFFFLAGLATGFAMVYLLQPANWWALIPGGTLATLAVVTLVQEFSGGDLSGLFFLGLAATFVVVYLAPTPQGRMQWALYPALGLLVMALFVGTSFTGLAGYFWPLLLIGGGLYLVAKRSQADPGGRAQGN